MLFTFLVLQLEISGTMLSSSKSNKFSLSHSSSQELEAPHWRRWYLSPELKKSFPSDFLSYPKLTYKLDLPFSKLAFNYREFCSSLPDLSNSVELESIPCFCNQSEFSTFINPHFGHVVTGDLGIVSDDILRRCFSYGTKYRPIFHISKIHYYNKLCYFLRQYIILFIQQ